MHGKEGKIWFGRNLMGHVGVMVGCIRMQPKCSAC